MPPPPQKNLSSFAATGSGIYVSSEIVAGLHDAILLFVESGLDGRFESSSISLHAIYLILFLFNWDDIQF
jgi:hypothetical protein